MTRTGRHRQAMMALTIASALAATLLPLRDARADSVCGQLLDRRNIPLRGATLWLLHPSHRGRIGPVYSNPNGQFCFWRLRGDRRPYYLQIYWGRRLIYQVPLRVAGNVRLRPIRF